MKLKTNLHAEKMVYVYGLNKQKRRLIYIQMGKKIDDGERMARGSGVGERREKNLAALTHSRRLPEGMCTYFIMAKLMETRWMHTVE